MVLALKLWKESTTLTLKIFAKQMMDMLVRRCLEGLIVKM